MRAPVPVARPYRGRPVGAGCHQPGGV